MYEWFPFKPMKTFSIDPSNLFIVKGFQSYKLPHTRGKCYFAVGNFTMLEHLPNHQIA